MNSMTKKVLVSALVLGLSSGVYAQAGGGGGGAGAGGAGAGAGAAGGGAGGTGTAEPGAEAGWAA